MWTAKISDVIKGDSSVVFLVDYFKDGIFKTNIKFENKDLSILNIMVINKLSELQKIDEININTLKGSNIDLTAIAPTQEQIDEETFFLDLRLFRKMQQAISFGLKTNEDQDFIDLQSKLKSNFLPKYINLF